MLKYALGVLAAFAAPSLALFADIDVPDTAGASALVLNAAAGARHARKPHPAGITEYRIESGRIERSYLLYVPESYDGRAPLPVIFDFHGSGSNPREEMAVSGMARAAERDGFLLLMPVAAVDFSLGGHTWNVPPENGLPDDLQFTVDVLADAAERVRIDESRVYVTGFSGGARLASELACTMPGRIAAFGAVGGLRAPPVCAGQPVPVVAFHGTSDPINPYDGGESDHWNHGVDVAVEGWVDRNGCAPRPVAVHIAEGVKELRYTGCRKGADVLLYRIEGGGHTWPGSSFPFPEERFGKTERKLDATRVMLEFFARHAATGARSLRASSTQ